MNVLDNFLKIKNSINSLSSTVKIIVVSKTFDINIINPIIKYGHNHFGENKVQEATIKWQPIISRYPNLNLHLVGNLQSNKAKDAVRLFNYIHSLSSEKLASILMKEENLINKKLKYFVQVNFTNLNQRIGIKPNEATSFIKYCINDLKLEIIGLMCIPPLNENPNSYFFQLKKIANENNLHELSMGMSNDYLDALKNGSTFVRIGSKIFGERISQ
jgi:pyridoxal phosphate enzyme (YggS family)